MDDDDDDDDVRMRAQLCLVVMMMNDKDRMRAVPLVLPSKLKIDKYQSGFRAGDDEVGGPIPVPLRPSNTVVGCLAAGWLHE